MLRRRVRCSDCGRALTVCACGDCVRADCGDCGATVDLRSADPVAVPDDGQATLDAVGGETA